MNLRQRINQKPQLAAAVAAAIAIIALIILLFTTRTPPLRDQGWFFDLGTGELFTADHTGIPPIAAPSGAGQGVRAVILGCGGCGESQRHLAWLEAYTAPARKALQVKQEAQVELSPDQEASIAAGLLIARPPQGSPPRWMPESSPEAATFTAGVLSGLCNGSKPVLCVPQP